MQHSYVSYMREECNTKKSWSGAVVVQDNTSEWLTLPKSVVRRHDKGSLMWIASPLPLLQESLSSSQCLVRCTDFVSLQLPVHKTMYLGHQIRHTERLADRVIHTAVERALDLLVPRVGRYGNDGDMTI